MFQPDQISIFWNMYFKVAFIRWNIDLEKNVNTFVGTWKAPQIAQHKVAES